MSKLLQFRATAIALAYLLLLSSTALASSKFLNVQGKLTDSSGNPLTGNQTVTFRLYTSSSASVASAFWTESQSVSLSSGLFNVALGTSTALDPIAFNQVYYLGMQVAGDSNELSPRQQLGASAYAQGSVGDFNVGNGLIVAGTSTVQGNAFSVGGGTFAVSGGYVVVGGTAAVRGNAFSVGGSSFTVTGGAATVAYSLTAGSLVSSSSVTASAFFGDASHMTGISSNSIGAMLAGTIIPFGSSTVPTGFLECNGASYSTATYPVLSGRIGCAWGCVDSSHFSVPDLRGVFLRGWNHSITTTTYTGDFDAASRSTITVGGNSGDKVGSYEPDQFATHSHTYYSPSTGGNAGQGASSGLWGAATQTGGAGGNETRPKNAFVMWLIKTDDTAIVANGLTVQSINATSSVTASAFFGDGSHLTGVTGGSSNTDVSSHTFLAQVEIDSGTYLNVAQASITYASNLYISTPGATLPLANLSTDTFKIRASSGLVVERDGDAVIALHSITGSGQVPAIDFQRGTDHDSYTDYSIYDLAGSWYFAQGIHTNPTVMLELDGNNGRIVTHQPLTEAYEVTSTTEEYQTGVLKMAVTSTATAVTPAYSVSGTTITPGQYPMTDWYSLVASTYIASSASAVAFAVDMTSGTWEIDVNVYGAAVSTCQVAMLINGDNGGNYDVSADNGVNGPWANGFMNYAYLLDNGASGRYDLSTATTHGIHVRYECFTNDKGEFSCGGKGAAYDTSNGILKPVTYSSFAYYKSGTTAFTSIRFQSWGAGSLSSTGKFRGTITIKRRN